MGIEPTLPAWKAGILPLNYTRKLNNWYSTHNKEKVNRFFENFFANRMLFLHFLIL